MALGANVMLRDGSRGDEGEAAASAAGRSKLSASQQNLAFSVERGNPLNLHFRDPPHLQELPRPILTGSESGLTT